jgi:2-polyprenyl-3-methyl-5-hydroxy-6-metoxy-1,4-benzoquinol methylase
MDTVAIERAKVSVVGVLAQVYAANSTATPAEGQGSVLDIGCGEGSLADFLSTDQQAGYVGVDMSKEAIFSAKRKRPTMKFVHCAAHKFHPKGHKTFKVISFADMLYYVDHKRVLEQYSGYLAPGGIVIICTYCVSCMFTVPHVLCTVN